MNASGPFRSSRRQFLQSSAAASLALPFAGPDLLRSLFRTGLRTEHVVVIAFAGGVRSKEVLETPANVPNLMRLGSAGVVFPNVRANNNGHYGAALAIFTGSMEVMGIRENQRGLNPTLFEYLRKDHALGGADVWLSTASGVQGRLFACSDHPDYGERYSAQVLDGDGIFNAEFQKVLATFGRPKQDSERDAAIQDRLASALDPDALKALKTGTADASQVRRVEKFILDELTGNTTKVTGPGASDAKAIRVGLNMLRVFKPKVLGITLQSADIAHGSYNGYVEVIRRNDQEIGKLWDAVQADPDLKDKTTVLILPEFGRDKDLNERNGLDHGDNSECLRRVFLIAAGPDCKRDKVIKTDISTHDVAPTVLSLFGRPVPRTMTGKVLKDLFA